MQKWRYTVFYQNYSGRGEDSAYSNKEDALQRARKLHKSQKHVRVGIFDEKERRVIWVDGGLTDERQKEYVEARHRQLQEAWAEQDLRDGE